MRFGIPDVRRCAASLDATDRMLVAFWGFLACVSLVFSARIPHWRPLLAAFALAAAAVCFLASAARSSPAGWVRSLHDWIAFPLVLFTYKALYYLIGPIHGGRDFDRLLIAADRWLFGTGWPVWLDRIANPLLTELLQIAYTLFYLYFIVVGLQLYCRRDGSPFRYFRFTSVYGFFLSYIGYFFLPAVGPRFTLHAYSDMHADLPGLGLTPLMRRFVDFFEAIPPEATDAVAAAVAQRDVFPSGHTMLTLVVLWLAYRYRVRARHVLLVAGLLLIVATVYLRYHYLVDVVAGALFALFALGTAPGLYAGFGEGRPARRE